MAVKTEALMVRMDIYTRAKLQALADDEDRPVANMVERLVSLAYRDLQSRKPDLPDDPVLLDGKVVSETRLLGEG